MSQAAASPTVVKTQITSPHQNPTIPNPSWSRTKMGGGKDSSSSSSSKPLSEDDLRALRGSKFAPLPAPPPAASRAKHPRLAHPGGLMKTNKAAALAKFLERKLQQPGGLDSLDPDLLEVAVKNAKETVAASKGGPSNSVRIVHVASFDDSSEDSEKDRQKPERKFTRKKWKKGSGLDKDHRQEREQKKTKKKKKKMKT